MFPFTGFAISEWHVKMLKKLVSNNIHIGYLVPFLSFETEQYGEKCENWMKIKFRLFKASHYII